MSCYGKEGGSLLAVGPLAYSLPVYHAAAAET